MSECEYGHALTGRLLPIRVPLQDDDGNPVLDTAGAPMATTLRLPEHVVRLPGVERDPEVVSSDGFIRPSRWEADPRGHVESSLDDSGLVMVICDHGLATHPSGRENWPRGGRSWIRSRYATLDFMCVVDRGDPVPDDLTTPRNA